VTLPDVPSLFRTKPLGAPVIARRYHFSLAGLAYALTTAVLVIGAINGQNNLLFWLFGLAVAGLVVSGILSGWSLMGIRVERDILTPRLHAGDDLRLRYRITNRNFIFPAFALTLEEMPDARSWLGRRFPASFAKYIRTPRGYLGYLGPRQSVTIDVAVPAHSRGELSLNAFRIASTFPIGLTRKSVTFAQPASLIIWPARLALAQSLTRQETQGRSTQRLRPHLSGDEFFALREFQQGDSIRSIAWRASARADKPLVRSMALRPGRRAWIIIDDRPLDSANAQSSPDPTLERIIAVAASLARDLLHRGSEVGLASLSRGSLLVPAAGDRHTSRLLDILTTLAPASAAAPPVRTHTTDATYLIHARTASSSSQSRELNVLDASIYSPALVPALPQASDESEAA
jgi:uncharacterized protein (DUF58 family)